MVRSMSDLQDTPQRTATLLAWYREMGVSVALQDEPVDWRARGDVAPGAGYEMPALARSAGSAGGSVQAGAQPAPAGVRGPRAPLPMDAPGTAPGAGASRAARPTPPMARPAPVIHPAERPAAGNVRSFATGGAPAAPAPVKVEAASLSALREALASYEGCALKATAKSLCLYRGAETARVMVIGEAPGREEDIAGEPFVGSPGQLLDKMLAAISLGAADVHLTNLVYWRPPGNRKPTPQEIAACAPFLLRQIELVAPQVIVLLGDTAARQMLSTTDSILKVRGKWREVTAGGRTIKTIATLDPSYVLRFAASKRQVWRDLQTIDAALQGSA